MKNWLILGMLVMLLGACQKAPDKSLSNPEYYRQQEAQVLIDLFDEIIAAHSQIFPSPESRGHDPDTFGVPLYIADSLFGKTSPGFSHRKIEPPLHIADSLSDQISPWNHRITGTGRVVSAAQRNLIRVHNDSITETVTLPAPVVTLVKHKGFHVVTIRRSVHLPQPFVGIGLSRVIFNRDFTQACFIHSLSCGEDCSEGTLLFARKQKGRWVITQRLGLWVA